jgi:hypothetical protein
VSLEAFWTPGCKEVTQRCQLEQVIDEKTPAETPKPNLEKTYVMVTVSLNPAITPLVEEI